MMTTPVLQPHWPSHEQGVGFPLAKQLPRDFCGTCTRIHAHTHTLTHILTYSHSPHLWAHALSTEHMPSQRLTEVSSHMVGPAPAMILKSTATVVCIHCVLGTLSSWTVGSELPINYREKLETDEEELGLSEMPGAGHEATVEENYIQPLRG